MTQYRDTVARAFAEVARLSVECVHSEDKLLFTTNLSPAEKEAFPGFVGRKVRPGGLVFLARKGASGKLDAHKYENEVLANALSSLKDASEWTALERFEVLMDHLRTFMCGWGAFRYVNRFVEMAQLTMDDISYINFVVFRAAGDNPFRQRVFDQAWNAYTHRILEALLLA